MTQLTRLKEMQCMNQVVMGNEDGRIVVMSVAQEQRLPRDWIAGVAIRGDRAYDSYCVVIFPPLTALRLLEEAASEMVTMEYEEIQRRQYKVEGDIVEAGYGPLTKTWVVW